jgi:hypothetical protein
VFFVEKQASLKPLKLKKWLTLPEAAQRLDVTEMDILQFALDGHLILSINFFKTTYAVTGRIIHVSEEEMYALMAEGASTGIYPNNLKWRRDEECDMDFLESIYLGEDNYCFSGGDFINIEEDKVFRINGILDLMMCHHGRTLIEDKLLALVGGEKEERPNVKGIYMKSSTGNICQLRKPFDYKEFQSDFELKIVRLKENLSCGDITNEEFEKQMNYHEQDRSDHLNKVIHPAKRRAKLSRVLGKRALKSFHPR